MKTRVVLCGAAWLALGMGMTPSEFAAVCASVETTTAKQDKAERARLPDQITPKIMDALEWRESRHNEKAVGKAGERGLYQIMEATWEEHTDYCFDDAFDGKKNKQVATAYLAWIEKYIRDRTKKEPTAAQILSAYNAGPSTLRRAKWRVEKMPRTTREYVASILERARACQ